MEDGSLTSVKSKSCGKFVISFYRIGRSFLFPFYEACDINYACNGLSVPFLQIP